MTEYPQCRVQTCGQPVLEVGDTCSHHSREPMHVPTDTLTKAGIVRVAPREIPCDICGKSVTSQWPVALCGACYAEWRQRGSEELLKGGRTKAQKRSAERKKKKANKDKAKRKLFGKD